MTSEQNKLSDADATWRDLALQFDGHRMDALSMIRYTVRCIEEYATVRDIMRDPLSTLKAFLAKPPLAGEAVLAHRIAALNPAVQDESVDVQHQFRLEWDAAARPPVHLEPMRGRQTFESFESALRFMGKQPADAKFVSLTQIISHSTDRSADARVALNAAQGGK